MSAETADNAGTPQLKQFHMVNIDMFRHPKYYKELRKRNKSDQVISLRAHDGECERAPGPGLKHQASSAKQQASSESKPEPSSGSQASSGKL
jgi:hypothetical protein